MTPAVVAAERAGIPFTLHEYEHEAGAAYGLEAAAKTGVDPARVFKTLVVAQDGALSVAIVPVAAQLDLRALGKRAALADRAAAERATGYVLGGISPLGQRQRLPTLLDESALGHETIYVSAGRRGLEIELAPDDLVRLTDARVAAVASGTMNPAREVVELHIVSDSTGETAARLVAALEAQFPEQPFEEIRHPQIQTLDDLQLAVSRAKGRPAVMVYTLVAREMREAMRTLCRSARLHYCDLLGHPIESIAKVSGMAARMTPGARPPLNSAYFKRMEAIEFAVKFDDGVGSGLREADVVLVGVSRTSKTPLSIYLGYLGQKAANVPIVKGIKPPPELIEIDPLKIVGLTIDAERLAEIRATRVRGMGGENRRYAEMLEIYDELEEAAALHRRLGCPVIDVTGLSIEETAHRVVRLVDRRRQEAHA